MAAKKSAKKTVDSAPAGDGATPTPVAKKAATKKVAAKKAAAKKEPKKAPAKTDVPSPAPAAAVAAPVAKKAVVAKKAAVKPSLDAIARAAYLNYRRRVEQGLPGDSHGDWLEAERQAAEQG